MLYALKVYYRKLNRESIGEVEAFDVTPTTYIVSWTLAVDYNNFCKRFKALQIGQGMCKEESMPAKHCKNNQWILKPVLMMAGKNIHLFKRIDDIAEFLVKQPRHSKWVLQKYIEKPLLFKGRKFDLRMFVLFNTNPENENEFNIHIYKQGYLRTSSS
jgi:hypothetical protein